MLIRLLLLRYWLLAQGSTELLYFMVSRGKWEFPMALVITENFGVSDISKIQNWYSPSF